MSKIVLRHATILIQTFPSSIGLIYVCLTRNIWPAVSLLMVQFPLIWNEWLKFTLRYSPVGFCIHLQRRHRYFPAFQADEVMKVEQTKGLEVRVMVFNATFNNISFISWRSVLLLEETGVPGENHRPAANHWQTLSHNVVSSTLDSNSKLYVVIGTDCI